MEAKHTRTLTKVTIVLLVLLGLYLQIRLWVGDGSIAEIWRLKQEITKQEQENAKLREQNRMLEARVQALKNGLDAIEERARNDLGMIKKGETYFMIVDEPDKQDADIEKGK